MLSTMKCWYDLRGLSQFTNSRWLSGVPGKPKACWGAVGDCPRRMGTTISSLTDHYNLKAAIFTVNKLCLENHIPKIIPFLRMTA